MATIGYNSTVNLAGESRDTTTVHFILSGHGTLTPGSDQELVKAGVWVPGGPANTAGQVEIAVYRVSTLARIGTVTVTCGNPGSDTAYEANYSAGIILSAGVEYCYAWRVVVDCSIMRYDTGGSTGDRSALTGSSALANPFVTTGAGLTSIWGMYVITQDYSVSGNANLFGGKLAGLLRGKL